MRIKSCRLSAIGTIHFVITDFNPLRRMLKVMWSAVGTIHIFHLASIWSEPTVLMITLCIYSPD